MHTRIGPEVLAVSAYKYSLSGDESDLPASLRPASIPATVVDWEQSTTLSYFTMLTVLWESPLPRALRNLD